MVSQRKPNGRASSLPAGIGMGAAAAIVLTLLGSALVGKLLDTQTLPENATGYSAMVILLAASFLGAETAWMKVKKLRLQVSLLTGLGYYLCLLAITALFFCGQHTGMGVTALVILAGCGAAGLLGLRKQRGGKGRSYPKQSR